MKLKGKCASVHKPLPTTLKSSSICLATLWNFNTTAYQNTKWQVMVWLNINLLPFDTFCQGSANCFARGPHKLQQLRARQLTYCGRFAIFHNRFPPNQQMFRKFIIFSLLTECIRGPYRMASQAGFGPRAIVWRPCILWMTTTCTYTLSFEALNLLDLCWFILARGA